VFSLALLYLLVDNKANLGYNSLKEIFMKDDINEIKKEAKELKLKLIGNSIYGIPITDDPDMLLVAAYHLGRLKEQKKNLDSLNIQFTA
jgi:hypothetical protein